MNRRAIRYTFLLLFVLLPLQYAVVGLAGLKGTEPWPALVLPGFQNVWDEGSRISMPVVDFRIHFADGATEAAAPSAVFSAIPASHHLAIMRRQFCPSSISGSEATERGRLPETTAWLAGRIAELFPGRQAQRVDVEWGRLELRRGESSPATIPVDTLKIELH